MNVSKIISSGVIGTSMMTLFSYAVAETKNKQFREPVLLAILLKRLLKSNNKPAMLFAGWIIHYKVGLLFTFVYDQLWQKTKTKPTILNGLVLGIICGLFGKEVWKIVLRLHPRPPQIDRNGFYSQLIVAHAIFGVFAALGYRLPKGRSKSSSKVFIDLT